MYRNIVVPTLREQKRQISAAHMSVGFVLFADMSPTVPRPFPRTGLEGSRPAADAGPMGIEWDGGVVSRCVELLPRGTEDNGGCCLVQRNGRRSEDKDWRSWE